jgi:formate C-acetyltransferase
MKYKTEKTERIDYLKEYYMTHSKMVLSRDDLVPWKCHRSLYLYVEGWVKNQYAPTVRIRRSMAEAYMLKNMNPVICDKELIVGQPDFSPFTEEESKKYKEYRFLYQYGIPLLKGRADHMALDYKKLLEKGVEGVIEEIKQKLDGVNVYDGREVEHYEFYVCCLTELEGVLALAENYKNYALELAEKASGDSKAEFLAIADTLSKVPAKPATTFREAMQSIHLFLYSLFGIYSIGRPDQYLYPYYKKDIDEGIMTESEAQEIIDCFYLQYMNNMSAWAAASFMIGGRDGEGKAVENRLTWHFLSAIEHTHIPDPNVGLCVTSETSNDILEYAAELIKSGHCQPQIWNNDGITKSMLSNGYDKKTANLFTQSTCVEITPIGCSGVSITSPYINLLKIFLNAFEKCDDGMKFDDIFSVFEKSFEDYLKNALIQENLFQLERKRNTTDPVRISAFVNDCIERGLSSDSGGAIYNDIEPNMLGMANVIESLNIINELVFKEQKLTVEQFKELLRTDYTENEDILAYIKNKVSHFGTNTKESNLIAKRVADTVVNTLKKFTTFRGANFVPGAFSYRDHEVHGRSTNASPDGRHKGDILADGSCPVQGYDNKGPTLSLSSTTSWEPLRFLGGVSVNVKLSPSVSTENIKALIEGYIKQNGIQLQFNVVDTQMLKDAQKNPDKYGDLIVRIGGYSDYFTKIPKRLQDDVIARSQN